MRTTRDAKILTASELVLARCERMHIMEHRSLRPFSSRQSRRVALRAGGAILAFAGGLSLHGASATQATPIVEDAARGLLLVQSFSTGSLFPTQGDAGGPPFTLILRDAAERGFFTVDGENGGAGFAPTESLLIAIEAGERPLAAVVVPGADGSADHQVWALRLASGGLGSDPGAVTYQGEPPEASEAADWLGITPMAFADGPVDLAAGYLLIAGLPSLDLPEGERVRIELR